MKKITALLAEDHLIVPERFWTLSERRPKTIDLDTSAAKVASDPSVIF
jgi:hypothetical protein